MEKVSSSPDVSIRSKQQTMHLRKVTVITLRAHFSQGIVKFNTLPLLTLDTSTIGKALHKVTV